MSLLLIPFFKQIHAIAGENTGTVPRRVSVRQYRRQCAVQIKPDHGIARRIAVAWTGYMFRCFHVSSYREVPCDSAADGAARKKAAELHLFAPWKTAKPQSRSTVCFSPLQKIMTQPLLSGPVRIL